MRRSLTLVVVAAAASQLGATECGQILQDPGFDLWCGSNLCAWTVEAGEVTHAPTWNSADWGAAFIGDPAAIEQTSPVTSNDTNCIEISLVANVDEDAEVDINLDANADYTVDYTQRIPTSHWALLTYEISIGGVFQGMRFEIAKRGSGNAVIARLQAQVSDECTYPPDFTIPATPLGGACNPYYGCGSDEICAGDSSDVYSCAGCNSDADCAPGDVCGVGIPASATLSAPTECVPAGQTPLGELCGSGGQCTTGVCTDGVCSSCATDADCGSGDGSDGSDGSSDGSGSGGSGSGGSDGSGSGSGGSGSASTNGGTCAPGWTTSAYAPHVCNPGQGSAASGAPCASNSDCASGTCNGTPGSQCDDGRACTSSADCPFEDSSSLQNGPCTPVGTIGGTCL